MDDPRISWGLKFLVLGFFWVGKFVKYFFGWLDLSRDFLGIENNLQSWLCSSAARVNLCSH